MNAIEKLTQETAKATAQQKMVAQYLTMRCKESKALCEDIMNPKKSLEKCWKYIFEQARKAATGGSFCESGDDPKTSKVFEWAEDYYHAKDLDIDKPKPAPQKFDVNKAVAKATASTKTPVKATPQKSKATVMPMPKKPEVKANEQFSLFDLF